MAFWSGWEAAAARRRILPNSRSAPGPGLHQVLKAIGKKPQPSCKQGPSYFVVLNSSRLRRNALPLAEFQGRSDIWTGWTTVTSTATSRPPSQPFSRMSSGRRCCLSVLPEFSLVMLLHVRMVAGLASECQ